MAALPSASRAYVGRFNFKGNDQQKFIGELSGGERNRVHLAALLKAGGNMLLLDEPTNDLDVETLAGAGKRHPGFPGLRYGDLRTTAGSWTGSLPIFWIIVTKAKLTSSKVTTQIMKLGSKPLMALPR